MSAVCILRYVDEIVFELQGKNRLQISSVCKDPTQ